MIGWEIVWIEYLVLKFMIMTPTPSQFADFRQSLPRFQTLLTQALQSAPGDASFIAEAEDGDRIQLERGASFPEFLLQPDAAGRTGGPVERLIAVARPETL